MLEKFILGMHLTLSVQALFIAMGEKEWHIKSVISDLGFLRLSVGYGDG